ncbi:MAG: hypothetical protein M3Z08_03905 [Chloroflexota bacterium]|nr:hypothetical protein [Chloroflexota bacterium]
MVTGIKHGRLHFASIVKSILFCCLLGCLCFMAACGTPADPAHPLSASDTPTASVTGDTAGTPGGQVAPIQVIASQTTVTTYPGGQMHMTISTSPYAVCTFLVTYGKSQPSSNPGVVPHTADTHGMVSWTWRVDGDAHTGAWPLTITAVLANGAKTGKRVTVHVTFPPINVVSAQSVLRAAPRATMQLTIATAPSVSCVLLLSYGAGKPVKRLGGHSDVSGIASWSWRVANSAMAGTYPLTVIVTLADGETGSTQINMLVV